MLDRRLRIFASRVADWRAADLLGFVWITIMRQMQESERKGQSRKRSMRASNQRDDGSERSEREVRVARFKKVTEQLLPERARKERWPLRLDHCFKRVCLDFAFGDVWYHHCAKPAERNLTGEALERAVRCGEELLAGDRALLELRNRMSLGFRGKERTRDDRLEKGV